MDAAQNILKFWHQIEFFQPYTPPDEEDDWGPKVNIMEQEFSREQHNVLPWCNPRVRSRLGISPEKKVQYALYLICFDKSEANIVASKALDCHSLADMNEFELEQRWDSEGITYFAKLIVDDAGCPMLDNLSVSTLPWALGILRQRKLELLDDANFDDQCQKLREAINRIELLLEPHPHHPEKKQLTPSVLRLLLQNLYAWAAFTPTGKDAPLFSIGWKEISSTLSNPSTRLPALPEDPQPSFASEDEEDEEGPMPILNSFYIQDIKRARHDLAQGNGSAPLKQYLLTKWQHIERTDLYQIPAGTALVTQHLSPRYLPPGRWPSPSKNNLSLLQQFAVNTLFGDGLCPALLSINGPPGTGKTTLLKDIVAQNVVERASMLASFSRARDTIVAIEKIEYGTSSFQVCRLADKLIGYEMVVASSNNAAVENISRDLPLIKSLGDEFASLRHFSPVANQLQASSRAGRLDAMRENELCWGLVSCALGNKNNAKKFCTRFFFHSHYEKNSDAEKQREKDEDYLNIWRCAKLDNTPSFHIAVNEFHDARTLLEEKMARLRKLEELHAQTANATEEVFYDSEQCALQEKTAELDRLIAAISLEQVHLSLFDEEQKNIDLEYQALKLKRPPWWVRLFFYRRLKSYRETLAATMQQLAAARKKCTSTKIKIANLEQVKAAQESATELARIALCNKQKEYASIVRQYNSLLIEFSGVLLPVNTLDPSSIALQQQGLWGHPLINRLRSEVFAKAMQVHAAWFKELRDEACFRNSLRALPSLLKGAPPLNGRNSAKYLWQLFFMIVPVVSSTFASFSRQFRELNANEIGWLLIDEAGQAVPQMAVGALWRAKRAVVVGDPLQIEPVFTTPPHLINKLGTNLLGDEYQEWAPHMKSVQNIADRCNPLGTYLSINGQTDWVGSPLNVHRRCKNPMFKVANNIAYNKRMIHGAAREDIAQDTADVRAVRHIYLGENAWIDLPGICTERQVVPEQCELVIDTLSALIKKERCLPEVFIITPFKAIKRKLYTGMNARRMLPVTMSQNISATDFKKWKNTHIGTVHTFQGKESATVIFVLGCSTLNSGGATWASDTANILNVAITRAKRNLFVIGDKEVWAKLDHFSTLFPELKCVGGTEWREQLISM